jgi:glutamate carboxypeptidase
VERDGRPHLRWRWGIPRVLLLGHFDTVWPLGSTTARPFAVEGGVAAGPGAFDMKAGIVQGLFALAALGRRDGVELLLTSDEELGAPTSRRLVEDAASAVGAVLVLEPSADGALKVARKGSSLYGVGVRGRAGARRAGARARRQRPGRALAHVLAVAALADPEAGTTVTPAVASAGTTTNTVPAAARFSVDVRAWSAEEQSRVDRAIRALAPIAPGRRAGDRRRHRPPAARAQRVGGPVRACPRARAGARPRSAVGRGGRRRLGRQPLGRARDPDARRARRRRRRRPRRGRARARRRDARAGGARAALTAELAA